MSWLILVLVGAVVGALLGVVGAGGGIVAVPALMLLGGASAAQASALSLAAVLAGALVGLLGRRGGGADQAVDWRSVVGFLAAGIPAAAWGASTAPLLPDAVLTWMLLAILLVALWRQLAGIRAKQATARERAAARSGAQAAGVGAALVPGVGAGLVPGVGAGLVPGAGAPLVHEAGAGDGAASASPSEGDAGTEGDRAPSCPQDEDPEAFPVSCWINRLAVGGVVGYLTGLLGVGGGFLVVPALTVLLGLSMRRAASTSLAIIAGTSVSGVATHLLAGHDALGADYPVQALILAGATAAVALLGARLSTRLSESLTKTVFLAALSVAILALGAKAALGL
ncbi:TSUP family transporter [Galactobacter valiniphilus]|uniref:TSUP family transporter n=1 Tax=Galactobacter valiniphilus TaxID=2676122 RepID=UPI0013147B90|nr:TSUP family transporter [Galactobacter valiniphilus]